VEPTDYNRRAWDEIHRRRADAMAGQLGIPETVRERLPEIKGKHVLHLQCATGESTAELAELGALVTGVDISAEATAVARERVPNGVFFEADVHTPTGRNKGPCGIWLGLLLPETQRCEDPLHLSRFNAQRSETLNPRRTKCDCTGRKWMRINIDRVFAGNSARDLADKFDAPCLCLQHIFAVSASFESPRGLRIHSQLSRSPAD